MISFECDYNNGAHPDVLLHLVETNSEQTLTYGFDRFSDSARKKIAEACGVDANDVHLLTWYVRLRRTSTCTRREPLRPAGTR